MNYYRLKQVDFNQTFTYSNIISVDADDEPGPSITIFPNPSDQSDRIQLMLRGVVRDTPAEITISTVNGYAINTFKATIDDFNQIKIDQSTSSTLSPGIYLVTVRFSTRVLVTKWIVR